MLPDQRRSEILNIVEQKGFASLGELAERVGASESTVRRDLEYFDGLGQIRRTRGGAAYVGDSITTFEDRVSKATEPKRRIAAAAAELIESGETVLLDGGTTTLEVARRLNGKSLQVVTNSLPIASLLAGSSSVELTLIGGYVYPQTGVALGPHAVATLERLHARRLVMSVGGVTQRGLFNSNLLLVETERKMMEAAEEVIVVCDSDKLGHSALAHLCELNAVDRMVVDGGITQEWQHVVKDAGIELIIAE